MHFDYITASSEQLLRFDEAQFVKLERKLADNLITAVNKSANFFKEDVEAYISAVYCDNHDYSAYVEIVHKAKQGVSLSELSDMISGYDTAIRETIAQLIMEIPKE